MAEVVADEARAILDAVEAMAPEVVELATLVSLALVVDPALVRAARRRFLPHVGPGIESDLTASALVARSDTRWVTFPAGIGAVLRARLATDPRLDQAWQLTLEQHDWLPGLSRAIEALRFAGTPVPERSTRVEAEIVAIQREVLTTIAGDGGATTSADLAAWGASLMAHLPADLRDLPGARFLLELAGTRELQPTPSSAVAEGDTPDADHGLAPPLPSAAYAVRLLDGGIEVDRWSDEHAGSTGHARLELPADATVVSVDGSAIELERLPRLFPLPGSTDPVVVDPSGTRSRLIRSGELDERRPLARAGAVPGHRAAVVAGVVIDDGRQMITASHDATIRFWDLATATCIRSIESPSLSIWNMVVTSDERLLVTSHDEGTVEVRQADSGGLMHRFDHGPGPVLGLALLAQDRLLIIGAAGGRLIVRNLETGEVVQAIDADLGMSPGVAVSRDGARLASTLGNSVRIWTVDAAGHVATDPGSKVSYTGFTDTRRVGFNAAGDQLAVTSAVDGVTIIDVDSGNRVRQLRGHRGEVSNCVYFDRDGPDGVRELLATASHDGTVRLWEPLKTATEVAVFKDAHERVDFVDTSPDGRLLVVGARDATVYVYDVETLTLRATLGGHPVMARSCAMDPTGTTVVTGLSTGQLLIWSADGDGTVGLLVNAHSSTVRGTAVSLDGRYVATSSIDQTARVWDAATGALIATLSGHVGEVRGVRFGADRQTVLTCGWDHTVRRWDLVTGQCLDVRSFGSPLSALTEAPGGEWMLAAGALTHMVPTEGMDRVVNGIGAPPMSCAVSPDGGQVAIGLANGSTVLVDPETLDIERTMVGHGGSVYGCAFIEHQAGVRLLTGSSDDTFIVWDPATGAELQRIITHNQGLTDLAAAPDGSVVVLTGLDGTTTWFRLDERGRYLADAVGAPALDLVLNGSAPLATIGAASELLRTSDPLGIVIGNGEAVIAALILSGTDQGDPVDLLATRPFWGNPESDLRAELEALAHYLGVPSIDDLALPLRPGASEHRLQVACRVIGHEQTVLLPLDLPDSVRNVRTVDLLMATMADADRPVEIGGVRYCRADVATEELLALADRLGRRQAIVAVDTTGALDAVGSRVVAAGGGTSDDGLEPRSWGRRWIEAERGRQHALRWLLDNAGSIGADAVERMYMTDRVAEVTAPDVVASSPSLADLPPVDSSLVELRVEIDSLGPRSDEVTHRRLRITDLVPPLDLGIEVSGRWTRFVVFGIVDPQRFEIAGPAPSMARIVSADGPPMLCVDLEADDAATRRTMLDHLLDQVGHSPSATAPAAPVLSGPVVDDWLRDSSIIEVARTDVVGQRWSVTYVDSSNSHCDVSVVDGGRWLRAETRLPSEVVLAAGDGDSAVDATCRWLNGEVRLARLLPDGDDVVVRADLPAEVAMQHPEQIESLVWSVATLAGWMRDDAIVAEAD